MFTYTKNPSNRRLILEIQTEEEKVHSLKKMLNKRNQLLYYKGALALDPSHSPRESYFTDMASLNLKGFVHLGILLMFSNHFMLILDNFLKYGILIQNTVKKYLIQFVRFSTNISDHGFYIGVLLVGVFYMLAFYIEKLDFDKKIKNNTTVFLF